MDNSAIEDYGLPVQDTDDGNNPATEPWDFVDFLFSNLESQQSENPQTSSEGTVKNSGLPLEDLFTEIQSEPDSTLKQLLNFTGPQAPENSDELQPPETETAQLTTEERILEERCLQTANQMRRGASTLDVYSRPILPASTSKPFGVNEGMMSDGHISSYRQDTSCVAPDPIMEAEQETNRASFSGVVSSFSAPVWPANILRPQAQRDQAGTVLCVGQTMHRNLQSSNVNKEDDPCGSGVRLEQLDHASGSNVTTTLTQYNLAHQYLVATTTSSNVPITNCTEHNNLLRTEDFNKDIKGARYTQGGRYISGYADSYEELQTVVTRHAQMTGSNWHLDKPVSARLSDKARVAFLKKFNDRGKARLFWMMNKGEPNILYDCVPFATGGIEQISCKHASKQRSKDVSFRKCGARIHVRSIWRFPSFPFRIAGNEKLSDIRKAMRRHLEHLSAYIAAGVVAPVERYYFSLPTARAHTSHKVPEFPRPGTHFTALHSTLVEEIRRLLQTGNTFITEVTEHIAQFAEGDLAVELALNPSDESLQVSREKVNGHIYHILKDGKITLPEPLSVLTEKQICCTHSPVRERSGTLSPQVLQPVCSDIQDSSGGEEDLDPCGNDQEPEQLGDEEKIALDGEREEVCCLLNVLRQHVYACDDIKYLQKLRCTLTNESCGMSSIVRTKPIPAHLRKRSTNTTDTPLPKKLA